MVLVVPFRLFGWNMYDELVELAKTLPSLSLDGVCRLALTFYVFVGLSIRHVVSIRCIIPHCWVL